MSMVQDEATAAHVATVMCIYEAFGQGDVPTILEQLDRDVEWEYGLSTDVPWLQPGRGHDHVAAFLATLAENIELDVFEPGEPLVNATQVAVPVRATLRHRATGRTVAEDPEIHLWTFGPAGTVVRFRHVVDTAGHRAIMPT